MIKYCISLLALAIVPVQASTLWQQLPDFNVKVLTGYGDQKFPDIPADSAYQVHDITVGEGGWHINSITTYYAGGTGNWPTTLDVLINYFAKTPTGTLPGSGDDPRNGSVYAAQMTAQPANDNTLFDVTAGGLDIYLAAGDWWIGMTPILAFDPDVQKFHTLSTATVGVPSAIINPGGGFGLGTDWMTYSAIAGPDADGAISIQGTTPEPATLWLLGGGLSGLCFLRRRK